MANAPLQFIHISGIKTGRGIFIFDPIGRRDGLEARIKMKEAVSTSLCIAAAVGIFAPGWHFGAEYTKERMATVFIGAIA